MSNEEYMIFYGEKDIDYTKSNNYAFLNWDFDNSRGGKNNVYQSVEDNFVMGNAYMGNAVLILNTKKDMELYLKKLKIFYILEMMKLDLLCLEILMSMRCILIIFLYHKR